MKVAAIILALTLTAHAQVTPVRPSPVIDWQYIALNSGYAASAGLDLWSTKRLLATGKYKEGNPLMPQSVGGQAAVDFGLVGLVAVESYWMKRRGYKKWWVAPTVGIGAHGFGVSWNLNR